MSKADLIFKENLKRILEEGSWDENPRPVYESDGEPAHSKFITQVFEEYDLSKGEFPILNLRPIAWKSAIKEALAIYQTQTNSHEGFLQHGIAWWKPWCNDQGDIGRAYAYNLESHRPNEMTRDVVTVDKVTIDEKYALPKDIPMVNKIENSVDGKVYFEDSFSPFIIIDKRTEITDNGTYKYTVQFLKSGNKKIIRGNDLNQQIKKNMPLKDNFDRTYYGIAYLGDYKKVENFTNEERELLLIKWESMLKRCYGTNEYTIKRHGAIGIFVHNEWHSFEQFLRDVRYIPQYHLAKEHDFKGWHLDKDYFGGNCYSKYTCTFLKSEENALYGRMKPLKIINKLTREESGVFIRYADAGRFIGVSEKALVTALNRKGRLNGIKYKDYDFQFVDDDKIYRYELSRNQINELLKNLEKDKYSRRHMLSFFNWQNQNKKMLVECAFQSLFSVRKTDGDYYLDLTLTTRSSDYIVAGHVNSIQYCAILMAVANEVGMKVGKFARLTQNMHVYSRHLDQAKELLSREADSNSQPKLILHGEGKRFYELTINDFEMVNYFPTKPQLKFELGI